MPPIYNTPTLSARLNDVINNVDAVGNGFCKLFNEFNALLSSMQLARPSATVSGNLLTFSGMPWVDPSAVLSGSPTTGIITDANGGTIIGGLTVGMSTAYDIVLSSSGIVAGQTIAITAATITGR